MISINVIIAILICHFVGDFVFHTREMADNKHHGGKWLFIHILLYSIPFSFCATVFGLWNIYFIALNVALHGFVDVITSNITQVYYKQKRIKAFFMTIGADQMVHSIILFVTYLLLAA